MTQYEILKRQLKEVAAQKEALEIELLKLEETQISTQAVSFILGFVLIVSNGAWFAAWSWV